jgi:ribosomal protein S18 acetylase RimI-like enzyme
MTLKKMNLVENDRALLADFIRLNEQWISRYFELEDTDRQLAENPGKVIDDGGYIFSLVAGREVLGVCALFNQGAGVFELARMAVSPDCQGRGYANLLIEVCLDKLAAVAASKVYLVSNTKLTAAIALYKKYGFATVSEGQHPVYSRANIVMQREL